MNLTGGFRAPKKAEKSREEIQNEKNSKEETGKFFGDGVTIRIDTNERNIEVTGDGCRVLVATNRGRIRIIGDGCRLRIEKNAGEIEYNGDGGRVYLGPDSSGTKVRYVGEGGRVNIAKSRRSSSRIRQPSGSAAATDRPRRDDPIDGDNFFDPSEATDNVIVTENRARRVIRTTCRTVRIVYGDQKILSGTKSSNKSVVTTKQCPIVS